MSLADHPDVPMDSQSPEDGDSQQTVVMEEQSQQGEQTAIPKEDSITAIPKEDSIMEDSITAVPKEDSITAVPKEDSITAVPKEDSITAVPKEDSIMEQTAVPKEDSITAVLKEDSIKDGGTQAVTGTCEMEQPTAGKEDGTAKEEGVKQEESKVKQGRLRSLCSVHYIVLPEIFARNLILQFITF